MNPASRLCATAVVALFAACATGQKPRTYAGGFIETQLDTNVWRVSFRGDGFTADERAMDFLLLRGAELTLGGGFGYFALVDPTVASSIDAYTMPKRGATTYGGQTSTYRRPGRVSTVIGFAERPNLNATVFDARFIWQSLGAKYGLELSSPALRQRSMSPPTRLARVMQPSAPDEPAAMAGCTKDTDCKGDRICSRGQCSDPR